MIDTAFIATLATLMAALFAWGFKTLPQERWQMIAAVPVAKDRHGEWRGLNLTFYGFFSATGCVFGIGLALLLLASVHVSMLVAVILVAAMLVVCVPASRLVAAIVEKKSNTYTIAGAAFIAAMLLPPLVWLGGKLFAGLGAHAVCRSHLGCCGDRIRTGGSDWTPGMHELRMLLWHAAARGVATVGKNLSSLQYCISRRDEESRLCLQLAG